jgi:hypothetical protein
MEFHKIDPWPSFSLLTIPWCAFRGRSTPTRPCRPSRTTPSGSRTTRAGSSDGTAPRSCGKFLAVKSATNVLIFKIFSAKKYAIITVIRVFVQKKDRDIGNYDKRQFLGRKLQKIDQKFVLELWTTFNPNLQIYVYDN